MKIKEQWKKIEIDLNYGYLSSLGFFYGGNNKFKRILLFVVVIWSFVVITACVMGTDPETCVGKQWLAIIKEPQNKIDDNTYWCNDQHSFL